MMNANESTSIFSNEILSKFHGNNKKYLAMITLSSLKNNTGKYTEESTNIHFNSIDEIYQLVGDDFEIEQINNLNNTFSLGSIYKNECFINIMENHGLRVAKKVYNHFKKNGRDLNESLEEILAQANKLKKSKIKTAEVKNKSIPLTELDHFFI